MLYTCIKSYCYTLLFRNQLANFHQVSFDPTVETGLKVCSDGHAPLTIMSIYGKMMMIKQNKKTNQKKKKKKNLLQNQELLK